MPEHRCRQRRPIPKEAVEVAPMEAAAEPMTRYISAALSDCVPRPCEDACHGFQNRVLLEQLVELSVSQNRLLVDLLGAVNALTAALLTSRAQV